MILGQLIRLIASVMVITITCCLSGCDDRSVQSNDLDAFTSRNRKVLASSVAEALDAKLVARSTPESFETSFTVVDSRDDLRV